MRAFLNWLFTPIFLVLFAGVLIFFHPILLITNSLNRRLGNRFLAAMNFCLLTALRAAGTRFSVTFDQQPPPNAHLIVVSNHQSMFDIPLLMWHFRRYALKFVSKIELVRGIPSVSYVLRAMGSVNIDRSERAAVLPLLKNWAQSLEQNGWSGCIFPEGTRARDGVMKPFKAAGLITLMRGAPSAVIVPVAIHDFWKIVRFGFRPVPFGTHVRMRVFAPVDRTGKSDEQVVEEAERLIRTEMEVLPNCSATPSERRSL